MDGIIPGFHIDYMIHAHPIPIKVDPHFMIIATELTELLCIIII